MAEQYSLWNPFVDQKKKKKLHLFIQQLWNVYYVAGMFIICWALGIHTKVYERIPSLKESIV